MKRGRKEIIRNETHAVSVQAMSQFGVPMKDIAAFIGISEPTLLKLYSREIERGRTVANHEIGKRLYEKAMDGDTTALIFWAKTRMGWKEKHTVDITNSDDSLNATNVLRYLSPEQIAALRGELNASAKQ